MSHLVEQRKNQELSNKKRLQFLVLNQNQSTSQHSNREVEKHPRAFLTQFRSSINPNSSPKHPASLSPFPNKKSVVSTTSAKKYQLDKYHHNLPDKRNLLSSLNNRPKIKRVSPFQHTNLKLLEQKARCNQNVIRRKEEFNYDDYQPIEGEKISFKGDNKAKQFKENTQKFGEEIRQNLILLMYNQIFQELDNRHQLNHLLQKNKVVWAKVLIRSKKFQELIAQMTQRSRFILQTEFKYNGEQIEEFLNYPRLENNKLKLIPPEPRDPLPHQRQNKRSSVVDNLNVHRKYSATNLLAQHQNPSTSVTGSPGKKSMLRRAMALAGMKKFHNPVPEKRQPPQELVQMKNRLKEIDTLMENLQNTNENLAYNIDEFNETSNKNNETRKQKFSNVGDKLAKHLEQMATEQAPTNDDINYFVKQGWKEYEMFEKQLAQQKLNYQIELRSMKHQFLRQMDWIKRKTAFRINALQTALIQVKLQKQLLQQRSMMQNEDRLSQEYNDYLNVHGIDQHISKSSDASDVPNIQVAKKRLTRFDKIIKTLNKKIKATNLDLNAALSKNAKMQEKLLNVQNQFSNSNDLVNKYKETIKLIISSTQLYKNSARNDQILQMIDLPGNGQEMSLNFIRDNPIDDIVGSLRRDSYIMRNKLKQMYEMLLNERVIKRSSIKKKSLAHQFAISAECRIFLHGIFNSVRIRQIMMLKEGQDAVGLLDQPIRINQEEEESEDQDQHQTSEYGGSSKNESYKHLKISKKGTTIQKSRKSSRNIDTQLVTPGIKSPRTKDSGEFADQQVDISQTSTKQRKSSMIVKRNQSYGKQSESFSSSKIKRIKTTAIGLVQRSFKKNSSSIKSNNNGRRFTQAQKISSSIGPQNTSVLEDKSIESQSLHVDWSREDLNDRLNTYENNKQDSQNRIQLINQNFDEQNLQAIPTGNESPASIQGILEEKIPKLPPQVVDTPSDFYTKFKQSSLKNMQLDRDDTEGLKSQNFRKVLETINSILLDYQQDSFCFIQEFIRPTTSGKLIAAQYLNISQDGIVIVDQDYAKQLKNFDEAHLFCKLFD